MVQTIRTNRIAKGIFFSTSPPALIILRPRTVGVKVRRESRWTSAGQPPARKLVPSTRWQSKSVVFRKRNAQFYRDFVAGSRASPIPLKGGDCYRLMVSVNQCPVQSLL